MSASELFLLANQTLQDIVKIVKTEDLGKVMPPDLTWRPNQTVRSVLNLYAYENKCVPQVLAGEKGLQNNTDFKDDLLGDDPQASFSKYHQLAQDAVKHLADLEKIVHISYGDFPAKQYLSDITIQRGIGAYDLAKFLGQDATLPEELVKGLWEIIVPIADQLREYGVFQAEVKIPEDSPLQDKLIALTGRTP